VVGHAGVCRLRPAGVLGHHGADACSTGGDRLARPCLAKGVDPVNGVVSDLLVLLPAVVTTWLFFAVVRGWGLKERST
jgi:hypothetical protein